MVVVGSSDHFSFAISSRLTMLFHGGMRHDRRADDASAAQCKCGLRPEIL